MSEKFVQLNEEVIKGLGQRIGPRQRRRDVERATGEGSRAADTSRPLRTQQGSLGLPPPLGHCGRDLTACTPTYVSRVKDLRFAICCSLLCMTKRMAAFPSHNVFVKASRK